MLFWKEASRDGRVVHCRTWGCELQFNAQSLESCVQEANREEEYWTRGQAMKRPRHEESKRVLILEADGPETW